MKTSFLVGAIILATSASVKAQSLTREKGDLRELAGIFDLGFDPFNLKNSKSKLNSGKGSKGRKGSKSEAPSDAPSLLPSLDPSTFPSSMPSTSFAPSESSAPSSIPTQSPAPTLSKMPSLIPSDGPSFLPSDVPSLVPSTTPSRSKGSKGSKGIFYAKAWKQRRRRPFDYRAKGRKNVPNIFVRY